MADVGPNAVPQGAVPATPRTALYDVGADGFLDAHFHAGQWRAWNSEARELLVIAGSQSGKTSFGPFWLMREIQRRGPGDYLVVAPSFPLLSLKLFPEFIRLFRTVLRWGGFTGAGSFAGRFLLDANGERSAFGATQAVPTQVFFCHALNSEAVESATAKAAWLDECGQRGFKLSVYDAVKRRCSVHRGRILMTTTPYVLGWLKHVIYDPWKRCAAGVCGCPDAAAPGHRHRSIEVVNFKSTENPAFPQAEYDERKATMPGWKFRMFYDGEFERPAGAIYEDFDKATCVVRPFALPDAWPRYLGLDFGGVHTAGVFLAAEVKPEANRRPKFDPVSGRVIPHVWEDCEGLKETGNLYLYREYPERGRWAGKSAAQHVRDLLTGEARLPRCWGGSKSEGQWRDEFRLARVTDEAGKVLVPGLNVREPPVSEVEVGINRVVAALRKRRLFVFDTCAGVIDQLESYSRELDDLGEPLEKIADKDEYHYCFVAGTRVATAAGDAPVEDVRVGDWVWTRAGLRPVVAAGSRGADVVALETTAGRLVGTPDHPVWVEGRGFVRLDALRYNDRVLTLSEPPEALCVPTERLPEAASGLNAPCTQASNGSATSTAAALSANTSTAGGRTASSTCIASCGRPSVARSRRATTFTTPTGTPSTTGCLTCGCSPGAGTRASTWPRPERRPKSGTARPRGASGTAGTPPDSVSGASARGGAATTAAGHTLLAPGRGTLIRRVSAPTTANRRPAGSPGLTSSPEDARIVPTRFGPTSTPGPRLVPALVRRVSGPAGRSRVYNLTVAGAHEYFANGILVSNCDALRYVMAHLEGGKKTFWMR